MLTDEQRSAIAAILETVARDGLPGPRDLDVALDAIQTVVQLSAKTPEQLPPIQPGEVIDQEFLRPLNVSTVELAQALALSLAETQDLLEGCRPITSPVADKLAAKFGPSPAYWLGLQRRYDQYAAADGQDRGAYTDDQDREAYTLDQDAEDW